MSDNSFGFETRSRGSFIVDAFDHREAREEQKGLTEVGSEPARSQEAVASDKGKRAPITTDLDRWMSNKDDLDFPGVDTPTKDPKVLEKDRPFISEEDLVDDAADDFF